MDVYRNITNSLFYKVEDGRVWCIKTLEKGMWINSNFSVDNFNLSIKIGTMILEIPANASLENE